jgi:signal transduction histidine kinase/ActR/RegA family two-component response regulator
MIQSRTAYAPAWPPAADRRLAAIVGAVSTALLVLALATLWLGTIELPPLPELPFFRGGSVLTLTATTAYLLNLRARHARSGPLLLLAAAYGVAALPQIPILLLYLPVVARTGAWVGGPSGSLWLWHAWHFVFSSLVLSYGIACWRRPGWTVARIRTVQAAMWSLAAIVTITICVIAETDAALLPALARGGAPDDAQSVWGLATLLLTTLAFGSLSLGRGWQTPLHGWLAVALVALFGETLNGTFAGAPFTARWFGSSIFGLIAAASLLGFFLREFALLHRHLRVALQQVVDANELLETRVVERTAELKAALADAEAAHEQLRQAEKVRLVGQLAAGVAHDFNNILQVVSGALDVASDGMMAGSEASVHVDAAARAAERGAKLTHQLLAYARKQVLEPVLVELPELLGGVQSILARTLSSRIRVELDVARDMPPVRVDSAQLQTALINLGINASHAMPGGGVLRIASVRAYVPDFGGLQPGEYVVINTSDTGTGMTPEVIARAFEPFYSTKGKDGTGLGLAMVQGFSRQSGGDTRIISGPGQGTRVEIWLPAARRDTADGPDTSVALAASNLVNSRPSGAGRVLLVDDSSDVLLTVRAFLSKSGFVVRHCASGDEALGLLATGEQFDVLITDYLMPGLTGKDLIEQSRAMQPDIQVLIITGFTDITVSEADRRGAALLRKPFKRDELVARVNALLTAAAEPRRTAGEARSGV